MRYKVLKAITSRQYNKIIPAGNVVDLTLSKEDHELLVEMGVLEVSSEPITVDAVTTAFESEGE